MTHQMINQLINAQSEGARTAPVRSRFKLTGAIEISGSGYGRAEQHGLAVVQCAAYDATSCRRRRLHLAGAQAKSPRPYGRQRLCQKPVAWRRGLAQPGIGLCPSLGLEVPTGDGPRSGSAGTG